jgi:hypothetical protein
MGYISVLNDFVPDASTVYYPLESVHSQSFAKIEDIVKTPIPIFLWN